MTMSELEARYGEVVTRILLAAKTVAAADAAVKLGDSLADDESLEQRDEALDALHTAIDAYELLHGALVNAGHKSG